MFINGLWCDAINGNSYELVNPATEQVIASITYGNKQDFDLAITAAQEAFLLWKQNTPYYRSEYLKRIASIIRENTGRFTQETIEETGKPYIEARSEWLVAANIFEWYAEECKRTYGKTLPTNRLDKRSYTVYQPIGVVGIITAWNFPVYNPSRACAAALSAGCTVILKGSEHTPLSTINLAKVIEMAELPVGVFNFISGEAAAIGAAMLSNKLIRKISFTGSISVGASLMNGASKTYTKLSLELGGNAPVIIENDISVDTIVSTAVAAKLRNCGQTCMSPQRFIVHESIYDDFVAKTVEALKKIQLGENKGAINNLGPLINKKKQQFVLDFIQRARTEGGKIACGGDKLEKGYFVTPCLIEVNNEQTFIQEEIFGPVMLVMSYKTKEQAIMYANNTEYGLSAYVFSNNINKALYYAENLEFGVVGINEWTAHGTELPFGGWKKSGMGHESGADGIMEYLELKLISIGGV